MTYRIVFIVSLSIIITFNVIDTYINLLYPPTPTTEENPVAKYILKTYNLPTLFALKSVGSCLTIACLTALFSFNKRLTLTISTSVAIILTILFTYMMLA